MTRFKVKRQQYDPLSLVVGMDLSSTTIAAYWRRLDGWTTGFRKWETYDVFMGAETCAMVQRMMRRWARTIEEDVVYVFIEQPLVAGVRNLQSTIKQAMVNGAVQGSLRHEGMHIVPTSVNTWKKSLVGKGGVGKDAVRKAVEARWPGAVDSLVTHTGRIDQDLYDAYGLCEHGTSVLARSIMVNDGKVQTRSN